MNKTDLVAFLKVVLEEVKRGASFEGRLSYTCMDDRCKVGEFLVEAFVRNDNDQGQGGVWLIEETEETKGTE
jgi:hypothetical protein